MLARIDPNDVHFKIVRLPSPPNFVQDDVQIAYEVGEHRETGPGEVRADLSEVSAAMAADSLQSIDTLNQGAAGKLIEDERFGALSGTSDEGDWRASGAYITNTSLGWPLSHVTFALDSVSVRGPGRGEVAFTRQVFFGSRLEFLIGCLVTPLDSYAAQRGRIQEKAFGRRISVRDLRENNEKVCATAVVYDGAPLDDTESQALWLVLSLLAGSRLQTSVTETYDDKGQLIERVYRPGVANGAFGAAPFHVHHASYEPGVFAILCDRVAGLLHADFPVDVLVAHLQDANEGSMERRMQSCLLGIHAASEAWNRVHGTTTIMPKDAWDKIKNQVAEVATTVAAAISPAIGTAVSNAIMGANNVGTNARLRACLKALSLAPAGPMKKAIDLRNPLFHDGFLQRRFSSLSRQQQQERYDQVQLLNEFLMRMIFAICDMNFPIHSISSPYHAINVKD